MNKKIYHNSAPDSYYALKTSIINAKFHLETLNHSIFEQFFNGLNACHHFHTR